MPLAGGTDKMSSDTAVGLYRTYVRLEPGEAFSHDTWTRGLRAGRTFHSGGPILRFRVDGREIGDTIDLPAGGGTVEVEASAESATPFHSLVLVGGRPRRRRRRGAEPASGGSSFASASASTGAGVARRPARRARLLCRPSHAGLVRRGVFAHTSPIYVAARNDGDWSMRDDGPRSSTS